MVQLAQFSLTTLKTNTGAGNRHHPSEIFLELT
jgi:hypothetical protein